MIDSGMLNRTSIAMAAFVGLAALIGTGSTCVAQNPSLRRMQQQMQQQQRQSQRRMDQAVKDAAAAAPDLPQDPQLLALHKEFITKAEKLAAEYERKKDYNSAREVFEAMARLIPKYPNADAGVKRMLQLQSMKDRKLTEVQADGGWQDSGAKLQKGMPVQVDVKGTWTVVLETGPEGVQIPDKVRPRDSRIKLGTLIGAIVSSPSELESATPFLVRPGDDFVADESGRLFLRMFDLDPSDNRGKLVVLIQSTFAD